MVDATSRQPSVLYTVQPRAPTIINAECRRFVKKLMVVGIAQKVQPHMSQFLENDYNWGKKLLHEFHTDEMSYTVILI